MDERMSEQQRKRLSERKTEDECGECHVRYDYDGERIVTHCTEHFADLCPGRKYGWTECRGC
jgi:hypothetical protein